MSRRRAGTPRFDVTIAGELNLDLLLYGLPETLIPERELIADRMTLTLGSSSAIVAHNLSVLGSRVGFVSRVGNDPLGEISLGRLAESGVDVSKVKKVRDEKSTGLTVILPRPNSRNILTYLGTMVDMCFGDLNLRYLTDSRHFHLSSFFLHRALRRDTAMLFRKMKMAGLTTSLDTNDDPEDRWGTDLFEILPFVDILFPNEREVTKIAGVADLEGAADKLAGIVPLVVVKRGAAGALARRGQETVTSPALTLRAVDPVGAGDSFNAGFLHQFVRGKDLPTCLACANLAGAFSTTRPGGTEAFRDRKYFRTFFGSHWNPQSGRIRAQSRSAAQVKP
jgi:sugar/nucleoside kinase (ribokinase family)